MLEPKLTSLLHHVLIPQHKRHLISTPLTTPNLLIYYALYLPLPRLVPHSVSFGTMHSRLELKPPEPIFLMLLELPLVSTPQYKQQKHLCLSSLLECKMPAHR